MVRVEIRTQDHIIRNLTLLASKREQVLATAKAIWGERSGVKGTV